MLSLSDIDRFFTELDRQFDSPLTVIITGAAAGAIMDNIRPSDDIDFEIQVPAADHKRQSQKLESCISTVAKNLQIPAQYAENIAGWSQISLLDYRAKALAYKKVGKIQINFLSPEYWAIGKLARYLPLDRMDLAQVIKNKKVKPERLIAVLAEALRKSPLSDKSREFKNHVSDFLKAEGPKIWGRSFVPSAAIEDFNRQAGSH